MRTFSLFFSLGFLLVCQVDAQSSGKKSYIQYSSYPQPFPSGVTAIAAGPDGALWFTDQQNTQIGRITVQGTITKFQIPTFQAEPSGITAGPDGALWFTEPNIMNPSKIGRITVDGVITEFPTATPFAGPQGITVGPDGALWYAGRNGQIGRITTSGQVVEYTVPTSFSGLNGITAGPDNALWFTESAANKIGRIDLTGKVTEFPCNLKPTGITKGSDGALWFTEYFGISRITTSGSITEFNLGPNLAGNPLGIIGQIASGPDGALWFTATWSVTASSLQYEAMPGRLTTGGALETFEPAGDLYSNPYGVTVGPDGGIWFVTSAPVELMYASSTIIRAPVCGLGMNLGIAGNTLTISFDLGTSVPATWNLWASVDGEPLAKIFSRQLPRIEPSVPFGIPVTLSSNDRLVSVLSSMVSSTGQTLCSDGATFP